MLRLCNHSVRHIQAWLGKESLEYSMCTLPTYNHQGLHHNRWCLKPEGLGKFNFRWSCQWSHDQRVRLELQWGLSSSEMESSTSRLRWPFLLCFRVWVCIRNNWNVRRQVCARHIGDWWRILELLSFGRVIPISSWWYRLANLSCCWI